MTKTKNFVKVIRKVVRNGIIVTVVFTIILGANKILDLKKDLKDAKLIIKRQETRIDEQIDKIGDLEYKIGNMNVKVKAKEEFRQTNPIVEAELETIKQKNPFINNTTIIGGAVVVTGAVLEIIKIISTLPVW